MLAYACHEHNNGKISDDPTISICWDADRLNLWRVGIVPQSKFLSSSIAKRWSIRLKAWSVQFQSFTWQDLVQQYMMLSDKVDK